MDSTYRSQLGNNDSGIAVGGNGCVLPYISIVIHVVQVSIPVN